MDRATACTYHDEQKWFSDNANAKETIASQSSKSTYQEQYVLDERGFEFVRKCIEVIESRGLEDEGLYRLVGVNSKVNKLTQIALDKQINEEVNLMDENEWEIKTITSALKNYFRNLSEPLLTFKLHSAFIAAAKQENKLQKVADIHSLIYQLPRSNLQLLEELVRHLRRVAKHSNKNLMTVSNLGVCFGPTLLRQHEQTVSAMLDIKFGNIVVEILIEYCDKIFGTIPVEQKHKRPVSMSYLASTSNDRHSVVFNEDIPVHLRTSEKGRVSFEEFEKFPNSTVNKPLTSHPTIVRTSKSGTLRTDINNSNAIPQKSYAGYVHSSDVLFHADHTGASVPKCYQKEVCDPEYLTMPSHGYPITVKKKALTVYNPTFYDNNLHLTNSCIESANSHLSPSSTSPVPSISHHSPTATPKTAPRGKLYANISYDTGIGDLRNDGCGKMLENFHNVKYYQVSAGYRNCYDADRTKRTIQYQPSPSPLPVTSGRKVRTLYSCVGENESELSFEPNQVIYNVRPSKEPGWLEGYLNGHIGLVPENYVEYLP